MMKNLTQTMIKNHEEISDMLRRFHNLHVQNKEKRIQSFIKFENMMKKHINNEEDIMNIASKLNNRSKKLLPIVSSLRMEHGKMLSILSSIKEDIINNQEIDTSDFRLILNRHKNVEERLFYPKIDKYLKEKDKIYIIKNLEEK